VVPAERIRVCYNGIDVPEPEPRVRPASGRAVRLLFVGHLSHAKGAVDLLEAFRLAANRVEQLTLDLIGAPIPIERNVTTPVIDKTPWDTALSVAQEACSGQIKTLGVVTGQEKYDLFNAADIFVLPSYAEAFPVSVLEAMASRLPMITTPVGVLPEVLDANVNVRFVEPGDVQAIADAIVALATDDELRHSMGAANFRLHQERFQQRHFEGSFLSVVREVSRT